MLGTGPATTQRGSTSRFLRVHLAGTFDGKTLQMFVNGKLTDTRQLTGSFTGSGFPMTIAASPSPNENGIDFAFAGLIDQVRISKTVRYSANFEVPAVFDADLPEKDSNLRPKG